MNKLKKENVAARFLFYHTVIYAIPPDSVVYGRALVAIDDALFAWRSSSHGSRVLGSQTLLCTCSPVEGHIYPCARGCRQLLSLFGTPFTCFGSVLVCSYGRLLGKHPYFQLYREGARYK